MTDGEGNTYIGDLLGEVEIPKDGILSRILLKNSRVNVTLFGFDEGQELSEHTAAMPAIIQIIKGEAQLVIGGEEHEAGSGSWTYMPARTPHSLAARTPVIMLLTLIKGPTES
jgi:quercetin dioxygenase-like cupin family protein